jgi:hypothetical protein
MSQLNRVLGSALLAFALLSGQVARADDEKAVSLLVKPKVGHVVRTRSIVKTSVMGMDLTVTETQKGTIKEVKENGDVVEETVDEGSVVNIGGTDQDQPATPPYISTHDKFGKIKVFRKVEANGFMSEDITKLMETVGAFILTDKAVKTNDTWETELDNPAVAGKKVTLKHTFLGVEKIDGKSYWKIKQTAEAAVDTDGAKMSFEATEWLDPMSGDAVKMNAVVKDVPTQVGPLTLNVVSKIIKEDDKDKPVK